MILIKEDYIVLTMSWKRKGKALNWSSESKKIERKVNGRMREATSRAMICVTEGAQQLKSILRLWTFQTVSRSLGRPDWCIQLRAERKQPRAKRLRGMVVRFHVKVWRWDPSKTDKDATIRGPLEFPFLDQKIPLALMGEIREDWGLMTSRQSSLILKS